MFEIDVSEMMLVVGGCHEADSFGKWVGCKLRELFWSSSDEGSTDSAVA